MKPALAALSLLIMFCIVRPPTPIEWAARTHNNDELRRLARRSSPAAIQAALVAAARSGNAEAIFRLRRAGADLSARSGFNKWTPLQHAIHENRVRSVEALLAAGADPQSGLWMAAGYGQAEIVAMLLERGAKPQFRNEEGNALDLAILGAKDIDRWTRGRCQIETVSVLLAFDPELRPSGYQHSGSCPEISLLVR